MQLPRDVHDYLGDPLPADGDVIESAVWAEVEAQRRVCVVPESLHEYDSDLAEALCRRVARNLAVRNLPLGFQTSSAEAAVAVTRIGVDSEIRRLEAPFRKLGLG